MAVEDGWITSASQRRNRVVEIGYEYGDIRKSGECDAVQCLVMAEPLELKAEGFRLSVMPAYRWGYESYCQVMAVSEQFLKAEPALLEVFLGVTLEGWRSALDEIETVASWIAEKYLPETGAALEAEMLEAFVPFIEGKVGRARIGWMETGRWERSIQRMVKNGMNRQPIPAEKS